MRFQMQFNESSDGVNRFRFAVVPWDTETFGFPIIDLQLEDGPIYSDAHLANWLTSFPKNQKTLVVTKVSPRNLRLVKQLCLLRFYPVEVIFLLELPLDRFVPVCAALPENIDIRPASDMDLPQLCSIAQQGWTLDRYHLDPNVPNDRADERFVGWITRAMLDRENVLVAVDRSEDLIAGYFHFREIGNGVVDLSSGAFRKDYQRTELVTILYEAVLLDCHVRGFRTLQTNTPCNNLSSLNLSLAYGSLIRGVHQTLHWFSPDLS